MSFVQDGGHGRSGKNVFSGIKVVHYPAPAFGEPHWEPAVPQGGPNSGGPERTGQGASRGRGGAVPLSVSWQTPG